MNQTSEIIKLLKTSDELKDAKTINKEIAEKVGCSLQHIYFAKRQMRKEDKKIKKYSHMYDVAFEVISNHPEGKDVTPEMIKKALISRITDLDKHNEWIEACAWINASEELL